jgi:hypothetical protein
MAVTTEDGENRLLHNVKNLLVTASHPKDDICRLRPVGALARLII